MTVKDQIIKIIKNQPDDSTYDEILRELVFENMIKRGLDDSANNRLISHENMEKEIRQWAK